MIRLSSGAGVSAVSGCTLNSGLDSKLATALQIRCARLLLDWSQADAAKASKVSVATISRLEASGILPGERTMGDLEAAFLAAGIEFVDEGGTFGVLVRKKR